MHERNEERAQVVAGGDGGPEERHGGAPHALRRLVVEELEVADGHERLRHAVEAVLRHQPEDGNGVTGGGVFPLLLDEAGDEGGEYGDDEADAHAAEEGDAAVEAGEAAGDGDKNAVV